MKKLSLADRAKMATTLIKTMNKLNQDAFNIGFETGVAECCKRMSLKPETIRKIVKSRQVKI